MGKQQRPLPAHFADNTDEIQGEPGRLGKFVRAAGDAMSSQPGGSAWRAAEAEDVLQKRVRVLLGDPVARPRDCSGGHGRRDLL